MFLTVIKTPSSRLSMISAMPVPSPYFMALSISCLIILSTPSMLLLIIASVRISVSKGILLIFSLSAYSSHTSSARVRL